MIERFQGEQNLQVLVDAISEQTIVQGDQNLAKVLAEVGSVREYAKGEVIIEQGAHDNDVHFIIAGKCAVIVNGRTLPVTRGAGTHVGEMAAVQPSQPRSATIVAEDITVTLSVSEQVFSETAMNFPKVWRHVAKELSRRLIQRNALISATHEKIHVFIMSSVEALPVARAIQNGLEHDPFQVTIWTDGVFRASTYPIDALEAQVEASDFAIAIAQGDDATTVRGSSWPTPRDNVVFELGFFMGRLGRQRTILVEPRDEQIKLPSDLAGLTALTYKWPEQAIHLSSALGPVCNKLRDLISDLGPNN